MPTHKTVSLHNFLTRIAYLGIHLGQLLLYDHPGTYNRWKFKSYSGRQRALSEVIDLCLIVSRSQKCLQAGQPRI